jgi:decaprenylphospho-beta-D-ribofuranose 2-oxidase
MSATEVRIGRDLRWQERTLSGWGGVAASRARVISVFSADDVVRAFGARLEASGGMIARGAGRSYGDAAQNGDGWVLDMSGLRQVIDVDEGRRQVTAQAGASLARILRCLATRGLTLPVVPGTRHVTVGGAIAADVHGKNHARDGSLAAHLVSLTLCTAAGETVQVTPDHELFAATVGGMGLTGVIVEATLRARRLPSAWFRTDTDRTRDLDATMALMARDKGQPHSVAWIDLLAPAGALGRGIVAHADHADVSEIPEPRRHRPTIGDPPRYSVSPRVPAGVLGPNRMRALNALRWRTTPASDRGRLVTMASHYFPLDALGDWNRLYRPAGLIQYQLAVPSGQERIVQTVAERLSDRQLPSYLAVLKRLGPPSGGLLSFPLEGWTLAVDLPAGAPGLASTLDELDELVAHAGGKVYLAKDVRLRPEVLAAMYPGLARLRAVRERVDPDGALRSDLARRLDLLAVGR